MRPFVVVEVQKAVERALERAPAYEILPPNGDAPVLVQDRFLQAFDEAVGPGMARLGACDADAQPAVKAPLNSFPLSVKARPNRQPACR